LATLSKQYPSSKLLVLALDVTDHTQVAAAFEATRIHFGQLDVVVNNAAHFLHAEIEATEDEAARKQMEVLFWGPVDISRQAVKFMRDVNPKGHGGRILNISSALGYVSNPTVAFYSAGKFALEAFTEALTKEMLPAWNIKAVILELGTFRTEAFSKIADIPVPAAYDFPDSPSVLFRKMFAGLGSLAIGDPHKAARAMMEIATLPDPPLRIQLGTDAMAMVMNQARQTMEDGRQFAELAHSTNMDGIDQDGEVITQMLEMLPECGPEV